MARRKCTQKLSLPPGLCGANLLTTQRCHQSGLISQSRGKYWQLNQNNWTNTQEYSRIQQHTKKPYKETIHNEYMQENLGLIDRTEKITLHGSAYPKISHKCTPTTHRSSELPGGPLEVFHTLITKVSLIHLGEGR